MKGFFEPFKIKSIEPIRSTSIQDREKYLSEANYNIFSLKSTDVLIDLLTDSGTSAMSCKQWAALQTGDESYAGSSSFYDFKKSIQELTPFKHIIPTHHGARLKIFWQYSFLINIKLFQITAILIPLVPTLKIIILMQLTYHVMKQLIYFL